jgi:ligand-binding SRPBCC domain-containing protein
MKQGALIDYKIKLSGIPFHWKTEISKWEPPFIFVDKQLKGPYKVWIHEHRFEEKDNKTYMTDTVEFLSPGWILEPLINKFFIEKKVKGIFDYREQKLKELFA